jgi:hypothetical protein
LEKVPSSIEQGAEQNSNLFEKYLSQVTAGRASRDSDSNVIQAGAMYLNVLCRSDLVLRAILSLVFKYFQVISYFSLSLSYRKLSNSSIMDSIFLFYRTTVINATLIMIVFPKVKFPSFSAVTMVPKRHSAYLQICLIILIGLE